MFDQADDVRELRRVERQALDRLDRLQWRLAVPIAIWLLMNIATLSLVAVTFHLADERQNGGSRFYFFPEQGFQFAEQLFPVSLAVAAGFGTLNFALSATIGIMTLWHRRSLPAVWIVAGASPSLILTAETALTVLLAFQYVR